MRRTLVVLLTTLAITLLGPAALALWIRPPIVPLLNDEGISSGCEVEVSRSGPITGPNIGPYAGSPGWFWHKVKLSCDSRWRAYKTVYGRQAVSDQGVRGEAFWGGGGYSWMSDDEVPSPEPFESSGKSMLSPCMLKSDGGIHLPGRNDLRWLIPLGSHQFILRGYAKVNEYKSDLHPYWGIAEKVITVTCTRERADYR